jgi:hypothetical protein
MQDIDMDIIYAYQIKWRTHISELARFVNDP